MGKGKAKGFRPPKDDKSMLFGSANHLTGNSIASPVQLRQEGIALPKNHMNYGDEWGKGTGKDGPTGANAVEVRPKASSEVKEEPKQEPKALEQKPKAKPAAPTKPKVVIEPSQPVGLSSTGGAGISEIERRRMAMKEIERRRQEMLQREVGAAGRTAEEAPAASGDEAGAKDEVQATGTDEGSLEEVKEEVAEEEEEEEDEISRAAARRRRLEEEEGGPAESEDRKRPRPAEPAAEPASGALKQGLQGWAERVNELAADGANAELAQACRDFVRKRILRAHAEGNLHSVDWAAELVPSAEELLASSEG